MKNHGGISLKHRATFTVMVRITELTYGIQIV